MSTQVSKSNPTIAIEGLWDEPRGAENLTLGEVFQSFALGASNNDTTSFQRAAFWVDMLGASTPLLKIGKVQVQRVMAAIDVQGGTKNRYVSALSSIYNHAIHRMHYEGDNPARGCKKWPENKCRQVALTEEEINRLLAASLLASWPKLRLLVLMAIVTGLRRGNLMSMRYKDVDEDGRLKVGRTKNGTPFVAVMTRELAAEFQRFAKNVDPDSLIFNSPEMPDKPFCFDKQYKGTILRAGLPLTINFHTLRHTCASILASKGASTIEIMEFMNHKTPAMAARYTHLNVNHRQKRAEELLGKLAGQRDASAA